MTAQSSRRLVHLRSGQGGRNLAQASRNTSFIDAVVDARIRLKQNGQRSVFHIRHTCSFEPIGREAAGHRVPLKTAACKCSRGLPQRLRGGCRRAHVVSKDTFEVFVLSELPRERVGQAITPGRLELRGGAGRLCRQPVLYRVRRCVFQSDPRCNVLSTLPERRETKLQRCVCPTVRSRAVPSVTRAEMTKVPR